MSLSFNKISVVAGDHAGYMYSPREFLDLPAQDRISLVLRKQVAFYFNDAEVDKRESLNELRKFTANKLN